MSLLTLSERAAPSTPASGKVAVYAKTDGNLYYMDDTGTERSVSTTTFADNETPSGTIDSSNRDFTLANTPSPSTSLRLYLNGVRMRHGTDYTLTTNAIQYSVGATPQTGDNHVADYRY